MRTPDGPDTNRDRRIHVEGLARVEGGGSLLVEVRDGAVAEVALEIFEPPRFFEALLVGRRADEAPDITARICGICPVAYQLSACAAVEAAAGVVVDARVRALRRLLYCGEWIQSHALHVYLLHAPDFLGYDDALALAGADRPALERGLALKRTGNELMAAVGGRAIHPVNVCVGGFYRAPAPDDLRRLLEPLRRAREAALATVAWVSGFDFPDLEAPYRFVALHDPDHYAIEGGEVRSSDGLRLDADGFAARVVEEHTPRSTALHARIDGSDPYLTGPLARYALNGEQLPAIAREAATRAGLGAECRNPFRSIVVRSVELVAACDEAVRLIEGYEPPDPPATALPRRAGTGTGTTEAPRGLLLHRYVLDADAVITSARIMAPTGQNHLTIEDDLRRVATAGLGLPEDRLARRCEQAIRNHDPCISCAAHFLDLTVRHR